MWKVDYRVQDRFGSRNRWTKLPIGGADMDAAYEFARALCEANRWEFISLTKWIERTPAPAAGPTEDEGKAVRGESPLYESEGRVTVRSESPPHEGKAVPAEAPPPEAKKNNTCAHCGSRKALKKRKPRRSGGPLATCTICGLVGPRGRVNNHVTGHLLAARSNGDAATEARCLDYLRGAVLTKSGSRYRELCKTMRVSS